MNIKKIQIINEILTEQMNHWLLFPLVLTVMGISRAVTGTGDPGLLLWAVCSLIPPVFFLFRCKIKYLIPFLLVHFVIVAITFLVPGPALMDRICSAFCALGYTLHSLTLRLKRDSLYSGCISLPAGIGFSAAAILLQHFQGTRGWENYYYLSVIAGIALHFIIYYTDRYLDFLSLNKSSTGFLPAAEMFHSGMGMVLGYTLLGTVLLIFSTQFEWLSGILQPLKELLFRFLRFLFSRIPAAEESAPPVVEEQPMTNIEGMGLPEASEPFWFWEVLEVVIIVVVGCGIAVGIAALLWRLIKLIRKYLVLRHHEQDIRTEDAVDLREKCELEKNTDKKGQGFFSALSPRERIRKLYKKKLLASTAQIQGQDRNSLDLHTAKEWEKKLEIHGIAELYEQARYSNREVTGADVKRMKEICRR